MEFYKAYKENIEKVFNVCYVHPSEIIKTTRPWDNHLRRSDKYINEYIDQKINLAADILKNGNYFPFWIYEDDDGNLVNWEGCHRMESIHLAIEAGLWSHQKVYCVIVKKEHWEDILREPDGGKIKINAIELKIPLTSNPDTNTFNFSVFGEPIIKMADELNFDRPWPIEVDSLKDAFRICGIYHKFLKKYFWKHERVLNNRIPSLFPLKKG